jgi:hypothetical protein
MEPTIMIVIECTIVEYYTINENDLPLKGITGNCETLKGYPTKSGAWLPQGVYNVKERDHTILVEENMLFGQNFLMVLNTSF